MLRASSTVMTLMLTETTDVRDGAGVGDGLGADVGGGLGEAVGVGVGIGVGAAVKVGATVVGGNVGTPVGACVGTFVVICHCRVSRSKFGAAIHCWPSYHA